MSDGHVAEADRRLSAKQAAQIIGIAEGWLREWRRRGKGPPYYRQVGRIYYLAADIAAWRQKNRVEPS